MWWLDVTTWAAWMAVMVGGLAVPSTDTSSNGSWRGNLGSIPSPTMVTWLVDGTNLMCSRNVPNDRETILRELSKMASPRCDGSNSGALDGGQRDKGNSHTTTKKKEMPLISNVVVVFDGTQDEDSDKTVVDTDRWLEWTVTDGRNRVKDRADDWIVEHAIPRLQTIIDRRLDDEEGSTKVNLVSADMDLQKRVRSTRILNGGSLVHPPRFWKDYLPILQEQQQERQQQQQRKQQGH